MPYKKKQRAFHFYHAMLIVTVLALIAGLYGLAYLWSYLEGYEQSNPKTLVKQMAGLLEQEAFDEAMELGQVDPSQFYDDAQYPAYLKEKLGEFSGLTIHELASAGTQERRFAIRGTAEGDGVRYVLTPKAGGEGEEFTSYSIRQEEIPTKAYTVYLPQGKTLLVNGRAVPETARDPQTTPVSSFSVLKDAAQIPQLVKYRLEGFTREPDFSLEGEAYTSVLDMGDGKAILPAAGEEERAERETLILKVAEVYARFTARDASREDMSGYLYRNSEFYTRMNAFDNSWFIDHDTAEFRNARIEQMTDYGEDCFTAEIYFDYYVKKGRTEKTYPTHYRMSFLRIDGQYRVANIEIL